MRCLLITIALALSVVPAVADACTCAIPSLETAVARADAVFVARVTRTTKQTSCHPRHRDWCTHRYRYELAVEGVWKGDVAATVTLNAGHGHGDCSRGSLGKTERWLFAVKRNTRTGELIARTCDGSRPATAARLERMRQLYGAPKPPK